MAVGSGKLLAVGMLAMGLAAAILSVSFLHGRTHRALGLWGPDQAVAIATAPVVMAVRFDPPLLEGNELTAAEAGQRVDATESYAVGGMRQLLVADSSYDWQADPAAKPAGWNYGLEFADPDGPQVDVLLDLTRGFVRDPKTGKTARLVDSSLEQLKTFLQRQFADGAPETPGK